MIDAEKNERFRKVLKASGLSQEKFGAAIGMSRSEVANIVYDKTEVKPAKISLLCKEYKIRKEWFLTGDGEMRASEDLGKAIGQLARDASGNREDVVRFFDRICQRLKTDDEIAAEIMMLYEVMKRLGWTPPEDKPESD